MKYGKQTHTHLVTPELDWAGHDAASHSKPDTRQRPLPHPAAGTQSHPSLTALVRLLARAAAAEFLAGQQSAALMKGQAA